MTGLTVPLLISLPQPEPAPSCASLSGITHENHSIACRAMQTWERLSLLRREISALRAWLRDSTPTRRLPSRWVVESRLQQLNEEADRLAELTESRRNQHGRHPLP